MRDVERVLRAAGGAGLRVVLLVLPIAQGADAVLPSYLVDRRARAGPRCLTGQRVAQGAPRDLYGDPLAVEAAADHLTRLTRAFSNHPQLAAWELTAGCTDAVRPRPGSGLEAWAGELTGVLRRTGDPVRWTLSAGECLEPRGLALPAIAALVDRVDVTAGLLDRPLLSPGGRRALPDPLDPGRAAAWPGFVATLAARLTATAVGVAQLAIAVPPDGDPTAPAGWDAAAAVRWARPAHELVRAALGATAPVGGGALLDLGPRCARLPLLQRDPARRFAGLCTGAGEPKPWATAAAAALARQPGAAAPALPALDPAAFLADADAAVPELFEEWWRTWAAPPAAGA